MLFSPSVLELGSGWHARYRARAAAQLILIDVIVFGAQAPPGQRRVAHGRIRAQRAATRRAGARALWQRGEPGEKAMLYAGVPAEKHRDGYEEFRKAEYLPCRVQVNQKLVGALET